MAGYAVYELTPAPWGDDYRFICIRDTIEGAKAVMAVLDKTDYDFSVYKIVKYERTKL